MKLIDPSDTNTASVIDKGVRNPWKVHWLSEVCDNGKLFSMWCKKMDIAGQCYCTVCSKVIVYGSSGKKALKFHAHQPDHVSRCISLASNSRLDSNPTAPDFKVTKSLPDSVAEVKSRIALFLSEHCLPFTLGPKILELCKQTNNEKGLGATTLSATSATYVTTHGVAEDIKDKISDNLKEKFISLNLDEATMESGDKVLNVLAQYFDEKLGKCIIDVIGSREINHAPAARVLEILNDVLVARNVDWSQVVSVLMDNCSVMRGRKEGVEAQARRRNEHLLDVDGDTVHKVNNAAQKLFSSVEKFHNVQSLASELHCDIENSPKQREFFKEIQSILGMRRKMLLRPISTRFLQFKTVAERIYELWDPLRLYYSSFLAPSEKKSTQSLISELAAKFHLTESEKNKLVSLITTISKQTLSESGKLRKDKIINFLFDHELKSLLCIKLHIGLLSKFEHYVKLFQSKKPQAHRLHQEIFDVVKNYFSCFIKPEAITSVTPSQLAKLNYKDVTLQLKDHHLCVGDVAYSTLMVALKDKVKYPWIKRFFSSLREGYVQASSSLLKLPVDHPILSKLAYISPCLQISSCTLPALIELAKKLPNVICTDDLGKLDSELRRYVCDNEVTMINCGSDDDEDFRIDCYWNTVFQLRSSSGPRYPLLSKLVKALLSVFSGPVVEGSFNVLNDIIEEDRSRLSNHNFESLLMIKSFMNAREMHASSMDIPKSMIKAVIHSYSKYSDFLRKQSAPCPSESVAPATTTSTTNTCTKSSSASSTSSPQVKNTSATSSSASSTNFSPLVKSSSQQSFNSSVLDTPTSSTSSAQLHHGHIPSSTSTPDKHLSASLSSSSSSTSPATNVAASKRKQTSLVGFFSKKQRVS